MIGPARRPRTKIRLDAELYGDTSQICSLTIAALGRQQLFSDTDLAKAAIGILKARSTLYGIPVYVYRIMPDHVHLVLSPADGCDLIAFVAQFKNLVQRAAWRTGLVGHIWQPRFWDHFLRGDEDLGRTVAYVLANPVRAGLVGTWQEYPYSGSLVFDNLELVGDTSRRVAVRTDTSRRVRRP